MNFLRSNFLWILIGLIAVFAAYVRVSIAATELLWLDELHTSWATHGSFPEVTKRAMLGNQQPCFFWLTKCSVSWFGHSEYSLRLVSILAGIGTLLVSCGLVWKWTQSATASFVVAMVITIDGQFLFYATEARPYGLVQLLGLVHVIVFAKLIWPNSPGCNVKISREKDSLPWMPYWGWAVVSLLLFYTHLTSIWIFVAEALFLAGVVFWQRHKMELLRLATTSLIIGVGLLPLLGQCAMIMNRKSNWESVSSLFRLWTESWTGWATLIAIPIIYLTVSRDVQKTRSDSKTEITVSPLAESNGQRRGLVFLWASVPFVLVTLLHVTRIAPLALSRYTMVGAAAFPIFAGLCIGGLSSHWNRLVLGALIIASTTFVNPVATNLLINGSLTQLRFEDWRTPIDEINSNIEKSNHPVYLFANVIEDRAAYTNQTHDFQEYLLFPLGGIDQIQNQNRIVAAGPTLEPTHFHDEQVKLAAEQGGAWLVIRAGDELVLEIVNEFGERLASFLEKTNLEPVISVLDSHVSPVRLISIDVVRRAKTSESN